MRFLRSLLGRLFGPPDQDGFARLVTATLRRLGDRRAVTYDKPGFRLLFTEDGKEAGVMNLANLHLEYCAAPRKDRDAMLLRSCRALLRPMDLPDDFEDVRPDLLPTVRPRSVVEMLRLETVVQGGEPAEMAWLPLTDHLVTCLVYDLPHSMQFVMADQLETWGQTPYQALEVAVQNLAEREFTMLGLGEKLYIIESGDSYDATRLLLKDHLRRLKLAGDPVAVPVTRNTLLVTGSEDAEGLAVVAQLAEKKAGEARPLCPIPVVLAGDEWETWHPAPGHPAREPFHRLAVQYLHGAYAEQKPLLEKRNEQTGTDVFVASYSAIQRDDRVLSWAVWSKDVPTWLPETDYVALYDPETKATRFAAWDRLRAVVGDRMEPLEHYPPRWAVTGFPTPEQIAVIGPEDWSG